MHQLFPLVRSGYYLYQSCLVPQLTKTGSRHTFMTVDCLTTISILYEKQNKYLS